MDTLREKNVTVTNASGIHATSIAEQVLGYILMFSRRLNEGLVRKSNREWRHYQSYELSEKTVTIVGLGAIGEEVVQRLQGFETHTIGVRYTPSKGGPTDEVIGFDDEDFHAALARTDYLVLASPLTDTTFGLVGEQEFATLPPESVLVNISRGKIVDTSDLVDALQHEQIRGAALDVVDPEPLPSDHPLWSLSNTLITPHNAGHTPKHWERLADIVASNVKQIEESEDYRGLENQVLVPQM
jgi:phosphoglycerate dehydrogenase-like enzyme